MSTRIFVHFYVLTNKHKYAILSLLLNKQQTIKETEVTALTNVTMLKIAMVRNHITVLEMCAKCGFSAGYFYKCLRGEQDFRVTEVRAICDCLHIDNDEMTAIFFSNNVAGKATSEETPNETASA